jgi:hypothetical protein
VRHGVREPGRLEQLTEQGRLPLQRVELVNLEEQRLHIAEVRATILQHGDFGAFDVELQKIDALGLEPTREAHGADLDRPSLQVTGERGHGA